MEYVMNDPNKYLIRDENTGFSLARMTNQREQGLVVRKVKERMDKVYERGFNVLEYDFVAQDLVDQYEKNKRSKKR